jgi:hypothetical protein
MFVQGLKFRVEVEGVQLRVDGLVLSVEVLGLSVYG